MSSSEPLLFFDGVCHLCNGFVDFLLRWDRKQVLRFAPLQGLTAEQVLSVAERTDLQSVVLWVDGTKYTRSEAVIKTLCVLGGPFRLASVAYIIPTLLRDGLYNWIARNRYAWFGQRQTCRLPTAEERSRLLL